MMYDTERDVKTVQLKLESLQELLQDLIDNLQRVDNFQSALNISILEENASRSRVLNTVFSREFSNVEATLLWLKQCECEYLDDKRED